MDKKLILSISSHQCRCGNKWTHSRLQLTVADLSIQGGTPSGPDLDLEVVKVDHWTMPIAPVCFRCCTAPLHLPESPAQRAGGSPQAPKSNPQSLDDI